LLLFPTSRWTLGSTQTSIQWIVKASSIGDKTTVAGGWSLTYIYC
jgi:hypothetical protein